MKISDQQRPATRVQRSTLNAQRVTIHSSRRRGATLLVTLGILTVLSMMAVAFLVTSRLQRQTAVSQQNRFAARNRLNETLHLAMRTVEDAFCYNNFTDAAVPPSGKPIVPQRLAPVGLWFSDGWQSLNNISKKYDFQTPGLLVSPISVDKENFSVWTVNLLTPEVLSLVPKAIHPTAGTTLRAGWQLIDPSGLEHKGTRIAFAVCDVSSFIDANSFISGPTTQKLPRVCFSQPDVTNWLLYAEKKDPERFAAIKDFVTLTRLNESPFFHLSYDPNPSAIPLTNGVNVISTLGTRTFVPTPKFDINSISSNFLSFAGIAGKKRLVEMSNRWFKNVTNALNSSTITDLINMEAQGGRDAYFGDVKKVAWNVVNYMTESRIPTAFSNNTFEGTNYPSRLDYAVEAVPLINEVKLKDVFESEKTDDFTGNINNTLYFEVLKSIDIRLRAQFQAPAGEIQPKVEIKWSNIFAFDVELWYPFKPVPSPQDTYLWLSVTTNSPSLFTPIIGPSGWLDDDETEYTLGTVLFGRWNTIYVSSLSSNVTNDLVWEAIQTNPVLLTYVEDPASFTTATNQTEIAQAFSDLWSLTYTNDTDSATVSNQPYTVVLKTTTLQYTNQITLAVLSNDLASVTDILHKPYREWGDGDYYAGELLRRFNATSASQFAEYERFEVSGYFAGKEFHVFNSTNLVYFPYVDTNNVDPNLIIIRFAALDEEEKKNGAPTGKCAAWLRPMVTVSEIQVPVLGLPGIPETVDEALLNRTFTEGSGYYKKWLKRGSISIDDPRDNAWTDCWPEQDAVLESMTDKDGAINNNFNTPDTFAEYPFIHYDQPFRSIGELGYINTALFTNIVNGKTEPPELENLKHPSGLSLPRDTIDLSTRSGAALLDRLSIGTFHSPTRGLIQANTAYESVLRHLHDGITFGWMNWYDSTPYPQLSDLSDAHVTDLIENWTNTLLKIDSDVHKFNWKTDMNGCPGWTCFADMLPDLYTNALKYMKIESDLKSQINTGVAATDTHNCIEDVLRGIVDKVSFRQNIFVIIVAAQALSPASTPSHPVVLADQRAAVTVIRDAYTGRWTIHSWTWLTE